MIGVVAALALGTGCMGSLCNPRALEPVFAKLQRQADPAQRRGRPVHILQIGDSHTAGDQITGAWRETLQARYGSGGRGVLPPGRPYDGFTTRGVTATMTGGWQIAATFGRGWQGIHPPLGLSAYSLTSGAAGDAIGLVADSNERFDRVVVCGIAGPGAGAIFVNVGGLSERIDYGSATRRPECRTIRTPSAAEQVDILVEAGPVTLTSIGTFRDAGGVAVSNLGVVGSQLVHFSRTDDQLIAEELREYQPDMIVLAFGTNEGFSGNFSPFEYEITLRNQIGRLRRLAGNVPVLIVGAPDAASRRAEMRRNTPGGEAQDCPGTLPAGAPAAAPAPSPAPQGPLAAIMAALRGEETPAAAPAAAPSANYPPGAVVQPLPPPDRPQPVSGLFPPPALKAVRDVQRRVAQSLGVAFWDWDQRMGGRCTSIAWVRANPALMRSDYVHFTSAGGRDIAGRLQADLDRAMQAR